MKDIIEKEITISRKIPVLEKKYCDSCKKYIGDFEPEPFDWKYSDIIETIPKSQTEWYFIEQRCKYNDSLESYDICPYCFLEFMTHFRYNACGTDDCLELYIQHKVEFQKRIKANFSF